MNFLLSSETTLGCDGGWPLDVDDGRHVRQREQRAYELLVRPQQRRDVARELRRPHVVGQAEEREVEVGEFGE